MEVCFQMGLIMRQIAGADVCSSYQQPVHQQPGGRLGLVDTRGDIATRVGRCHS